VKEIPKTQVLILKTFGSFAIVLSLALFNIVFAQDRDNLQTLPSLSEEELKDVQQVLNRSYPFSPIELEIPVDPAAIADGERLGRLHGCLVCHGADASGNSYGNPEVGQLIMPNLTASVRKYNDAQLVGMIKSGVHASGRSLIGMPSQSFVMVVDEELGKILSYIKSLPLAEGPESGGLVLGPLFYPMVSSPDFMPTAELVEQVRAGRHRIPEASTPESEVGHYLAQTVCSHCHGIELSGTPREGTPHLAIASAYSLEDFARLLRTGIALGERESRMIGTATEMLQVLTESEIASIYSYLRNDFIGTGR
jgi:mono/diheme cytochrome c family protein